MPDDDHTEKWAKRGPRGRTAFNLTLLALLVLFVAMVIAYRVMVATS